MRITEELLLSAVKASPNQTASQAVAKATHVRLNGKQIERIENLERCSNMQVLYLYDNRIVQVENLHTAAHLTHLYLQNNRIAELSNFATLRRLQKLYLDGNCINHLSGLEALQSLEELHISRQQIPTETVFSIDETCMMGLSSSLVILTISGNHLVDPLPLRHLRALQKLDASDNRIHDIEMVKVVMQSCRSLRQVELTGNPIASQPRYTHHLIISSSSLESLDGKDIPPQQRQAMLTLGAKKSSAK